MFARYDKSALTAQRGFFKLQKWLLILCVITALLAALYSSAEANIFNIAELAPEWLRQPINIYALPVIGVLAFLAPIVLLILVAGIAKFSNDTRWKVLRSSAETIKKEIYRYRTQVSEYSFESTKTESRDAKLARKLQQIAQRVMASQAQQSGLEVYRGDTVPKFGTPEGDDGLSNLTPLEYVSYRIDDQLSYYQKKAFHLSYELQKFQWLSYGFIGLSIVLAVFGLHEWAIVSLVLFLVCTVYMNFRRMAEQTTESNVAASDLYNIRLWWRALPEAEKAQQSNIETLVNAVETVLQSDTGQWGQETREALNIIYQKG